MNLSTKGRYSVMAMIELAEKEKGIVTSLSHLAEKQGLSVNYLEQIFNKLRKGGLVQSVRGIGGGYYLTRLSHEITVLDIMIAVGEPLKATRCDASSSKGCMNNGNSRCFTHDLWAELENTIKGYLSFITLEMVIKRRVKGTGFYNFLPAQEPGIDNGKRYQRAMI